MAAMETQRFIEKLKERISSGLVFMGAAYANRWVSERFMRKYLGEWSELGVGAGTAVALDALGIRARLGQVEPYVNQLADAMSDYGFYESILQAKVVKLPKCWAPDSNTIKCINFDADTVDTTTVTVYVDDAQQTVSGVTGTPSSFEIALSAPLTTGWKKLVVIAGNTKKDVFRAKIYVP